MWRYASARFAGACAESVPLIASPGDELLLTHAGLLHAAAAVLVDDRLAVADALNHGAGLGLLPSFLRWRPSGAIRSTTTATAGWTT